MRLLFCQRNSGTDGLCAVQTHWISPYDTYIIPKGIILQFCHLSSRTIPNSISFSLKLSIVAKAVKNELSLFISNGTIGQSVLYLSNKPLRGFIADINSHSTCTVFSFMSSPSSKFTMSKKSLKET